MLPTFLLIGAMKAGTTSLHAYLRSHPAIFMAEPKELDFFVAGKNWERGIGWYESRFAQADESNARGEASTNYTKHPFFSDVPGRIEQTIPDVRLLYVVRHPIRRMVSQYWHHVAEYGERRPIAESLLTNPMLFALSDYAMQIERYLEHFPRKQLLVITSEALRDRRAETLRSVFSFLGVDPEVEPANLSDELHRSDAKTAPTSLAYRFPVLQRLADNPSLPAVISRRLRRLTRRRASRETVAVPPSVEVELRARLRPSVQRLRAHMPADFDGWGIG